MKNQKSLWQRFQAYLAQRKLAKLNQRLDDILSNPHFKTSDHAYIADQIKSIIEDGASVNYQGGHGAKTSLLTYGILTCNHQLCNYLLANNVDVNVKNTNGSTPLLLATTNFEGLIPKLLAHGAQIDCQDKQGLSPLMQAAKRDNHKLVTYLLAKGANPNLTDQHKQSALFYTGSNPHITQTLLQQGANPKQISLSKTTPLFAAQNPKVIELLIKYGADVNHRDFNKKTPLMVMANRPDLVKVLLQCGADPTLCDSVNDTALHFAQNPQSISLLVEAGADIDARGFGEETPLLRLAENPYTTTETINALLQYAPVPFSQSVKDPRNHPGHVNDDDNWVPDGLGIWSYTRNPKLKEILVEYQERWYRGNLRSRVAAKSRKPRVTFTPSSKTSKHAYIPEGRPNAKY